MFTNKTTIASVPVGTYLLMIVDPETSELKIQKVANLSEQTTLNPNLHTVSNTTDFYKKELTEELILKEYLEENPIKDDDGDDNDDNNDNEDNGDNDNVDDNDDDNDIEDYGDNDNGDDNDDDNDIEDNGDNDDVDNTYVMGDGSMETAETVEIISQTVLLEPQSSRPNFKLKKKEDEEEQEEETITEHDYCYTEVDDKPAKEARNTRRIKIQCDFCKRKYSNDYQFAIHSIIHSEDKHYSCPLCDLKTISKVELRDHIEDHYGKARHKCVICQRRFVHSIDAENHVNFHNGVKPFKCDICGKCYTYLRLLRSHKRRTHVEYRSEKNVVNYNCFKCKRYFITEEGLNKHNLKFHIGGANNTKIRIDVARLCHICGKRLANRACFSTHMRTHTGVKPYKCEFCEREFRGKGTLIVHRRIHTGEKPYKCAFCEKGFSQQTAKQSHERTHTGERPYVCAFCTKGFMTISHLSQHKKSCIKAKMLSKETSDSE